MKWSEWSSVTPLTCCNQEALKMTLEGGQSFRWKRLEIDGSICWEGSWLRYICRLRIGNEGFVEYSTLPGCEDDLAPALLEYLQLNTDFEKLLDQLPWRSDLVLQKAIHALKGLRLLKQPFGETLLCYLCSSNKQIVQIRQICALLAERFGMQPSEGVFNLPDWERLSEVSLDDLIDCKLGYRAKYIYKVAQFLKENPGWLDETEKLPYADARKRLLQLTGVGEKVADCVLLYGAAKYESFPVDVWVERAMSRHYDLKGWTKEQIAHFGRQHFSNGAGLAQQYLFEAERLGRM